MSDDAAPPPPRCEPDAVTKYRLNYIGEAAFDRALATMLGRYFDWRAKKISAEDLAEMVGRDIQTMMEKRRRRRRAMRHLWRWINAHR